MILNDLMVAYQAEGKEEKARKLSGRGVSLPPGPAPAGPPRLPSSLEGTDAPRAARRSGPTLSLDAPG